MAEAPRYRFGPLERRGVLLGLRLSQIIVLFVGGLLLVGLGRELPPSGALAALLVIGVATSFAAFVPIAGRALDEWFPVATRWLVASVLRRRVFSSSQPERGLTSLTDPQPSFPDCLKGLQILSHRVPNSESRIGVVKDMRSGTFTGVLSVRGRSFALLDGQEKARRLASWAGILSGLAREGGVVHRLQWIERTVPDTSDEIGAYLKDNIAVPLDSLIARSYLEVVDEAGPVTQQHETYVSLQIHAGRSARAVKTAGGGDEGACEVLRRELTALSSKLMGCEVSVLGALTPRLIAGALRTGFDPASRDSLVHISTRNDEREGTSISNAGPMATETSWSSFRSDGAWHATYWIAEWPRIDADPDFLAPLLLRTECMRTVSLTMEPISPLRAIRSVESARTSAVADEELRERAGFLTTSRRTREQESLANHERDLSDGHAFYRFAGFVTVTAADPDGLERACGEIEEAAGRSFLDLRRMRGEQDHAFTYTLPLCRGLR
ncbi:MAG: hypothetical protein QOG54_1401 [Actinomycetota bacterium]|nr:hypothetical protein [Actinomycetota bacterium]